MGRHSIPDPGDDFPAPGDDFTEPEYADADPYLAEPTEAGPPETPRPTGSTGSTSRYNSGEWTGSHRIVQPHRRGVSPAVIAALVAVVVVVAAVILWRFFGDALSNRSNLAAHRCLEGEAKVAVLADGAIADTIGTLAKKFNDTAGPVGDHCVAVNVAATDSGGVVDGLTGTWPSSLGDKPALWIPGSSVDVTRLEAAAGPKIVTTSTSLAKSPVLLAVRPALKDALAEQNWSTLPSLQNDPNALDGLNLAGWGPLRLALPTAGNSDATHLAAEAVAVASAPEGAPATAGVGAVNSLIAGQPKLSDNTLDVAMDALLKSSDPAAAPVHAVVLTEQQLVKRAAGLPDAASALAGWLPPGPVAVADFPATLLTGDWVDEAQASAASEFERFLHKPEQLAELAKAGFRVDGVTPPASPVTNFAPLPATLSVGDDAARVALANVLSTPAGAGTTTVMLSRSLNVGPVAAALKARIGALAPTASVGLTTFNGTEGTTVVTTGPLTDQIDGQPRSEELAQTLAGLSSSSNGAVSFTTLRNVYADALTNFRPGQPNSVLVITAGPHTDQSLGAEGLKELMRSSVDPARPVAVNVINIGDDPNRATWEAVAQISGGTYQNVQSSDSPELLNAVTQLLQ
ncbi:MAG TPA: substrate-binding domain-containing protein [Mycobacterium sp.]|nr:substrate-binding domain-containing protein [Mycobacterium sp.]